MNMLSGCDEMVGFFFFLPFTLVRVFVMSSERVRHHSLSVFTHSHQLLFANHAPPHTHTHAISGSWESVFSSGRFALLLQWCFLKEFSWLAAQTVHRHGESFTRSDWKETMQQKSRFILEQIVTQLSNHTCGQAN